MKVRNAQAVFVSILIALACCCFTGLVFIDAMPQYMFGAKFGGFIFALAGVIGIGFWGMGEGDIDYSVAGIFGFIGLVFGLISMMEGKVLSSTAYLMVFELEMLMTSVIVGFLLVPSIQWRPALARR